MDEGVLYVAPLGTAEPDFHTHQGTFTQSPLLVSDWELLSPVSDAVTSLRTESGGFRSGTLTVVSLARTVTDSGLRVLAQGRVQLLWENAAGNQRVLFPQVATGNTFTATRRKEASIEWTFTLEKPPDTWCTGSGGVEMKFDIDNSGWAAGTTHTGTILYNPGTTFAATSRTNVAATTPTPDKDNSIPNLVPGRLIGYREWDIEPADDLRPARLISLAARTVWPWTPTLTAYCHRTDMARQFMQFRDPVPEHRPDEAPYPPCSCGIYAKYRPISFSTTTRMTGVIEAWGDIELGIDAFRAQHARIVALCTDNSQWGWSDLSLLDKQKWAKRPLQELSKLYSAPLMRHDDMVEKYPPTDITGLRTQKEEIDPGGPRCPQCNLSMLFSKRLDDPDFPKKLWICPTCPHEWVTPIITNIR